MWLSKDITTDIMSKIGLVGLEYTHRRFYSKYKGTVEENLDPQAQGRVQVSVVDTGKVQITGNKITPQTLELFAYPSSPFAGDNYGFYFPPEVGDSVWVWFDMGDPTIPHISGGWWKNMGSSPPQSDSVNITSQTPQGQKSTVKPSTTSQIPVEFNSNLNGSINTNKASETSLLTSRGIKTRLGHGILFEDDDEYGRDTGVTLWTGSAAPEPTSQAGIAPKPQPAIRHHSINLSDRDERITISTFGPGPAQNGHTTIWDDLPATQGIRTTSIYGHTINVDDVAKSITIKTKLGHQIVISDTLNSITAKTVLGNTLLLSDQAQTASITTIGQQSVVLNDTALTTAVTTPGIVSVTAGGAATITAGAAATVTAAGALAITGTGVAITSAGGGPSISFASGVSENTFVGLVNENYLGALEQIVIGAWNVTAATATIISNLIALGSATGTKFYLVTDAFIDAFNLHTHPIPAPAVSTVTSTPSTPLVKSSFVTHDVQAS